MSTRQNGLSLIELLISLTLGIVLMTGVAQMFLTSKETYTTQQAISRIQETGRMAINFLSHDVRMAGYMGCNSRVTDITNTVNNSDSLVYNFNQPIEGIDDYDDSAPDDYPDAEEGTDVLVVRSANGNAVGVDKMNSSNTVFVDYTGEQAGACPGGGTSYSGFCEGEILVIADCEKARVFQVTSINVASDEVNIGHNSSGDPGNTPSSWGGASNPDENFNTDAEVIKVSTQIYYVAENDFGRPSLWRKVDSRPAEELVEGVEDLQILYGHSSGDDPPDTYEAASDLSSDDWNNVKSIRVRMLIQSPMDNVVPEPHSYTFNGQTVDDPGDRRLRQVFVSTIGIRSRLP